MKFPIAHFMRGPIAACGFALVLLPLTASLSAQTDWTLTTSDFQTRAINLIGLDDAGAKFTEPSPGAVESNIPWVQILQMERTQPPTPTAPAATKPAPSFILHLANGDRLPGEAFSLEGEILAWNSPAAGRVEVKLNGVTAISRAGEPVVRGGAPRTEDVITLTNGDTARGLLSAVDAATITMQAAGTPVTLPWDAIRTVALAAVPTNVQAKDERTVRITLADGSILSGATIVMTADKATLNAGGATRDLASAAVVAIEQINGPVAWLSSLIPTESVQIPFLETVFPARMDRTVRGEPIRFGDRTFPRGIGVHAYSRMTWELPQGRYKTFRAQYAIDGDNPYANVIVRVKLDDKVVHEAENFVAGKLAEVVQAPLAGAKMLTLEVDYGKTYDVQDRFNWIEPALLAE